MIKSVKVPVCRRERYMPGEFPDIFLFNQCYEWNKSIEGTCFSALSYKICTYNENIV